MTKSFLVIEKSDALQGEVKLSGAKNAVLVIMASMLLTSGISKLSNVPASSDVYAMIDLLEAFGAFIEFDDQHGIMTIDTSSISRGKISAKMMQKMRASILVMGPLLGQLGSVEVFLPGGCSIGARPIDLHLKAFEKLGTILEYNSRSIYAHIGQLYRQVRVIFDYPSVGATENTLMLAAIREGQQTTIVNAALEPEVFDLIAVLKKMGAKITVSAPSKIEIMGVAKLNAISHEIMPDRLEAGTFLLAAAITGGSLTLHEAPIKYMDVFIEKLYEMGHYVALDREKNSIFIKASKNYRCISFKTMPYPGFPTDLQAPTMAVLSRAHGVSKIHETVFENRLQHVPALIKMGAQITTTKGIACITGVTKLKGAIVKATDIRAGAALVLAGLAAAGQTVITDIQHIERGYDNMVAKLKTVGASIKYDNELSYTAENY